MRGVLYQDESDRTWANLSLTLPILQYDIKSRGAEAYLALARELAGRVR